MRVGLATITLTVAILALGTGTASASLLCTTVSCTKTYEANTALAASLKEGTKATLLSTTGTVECKSSAIAGKTKSGAGRPLPLEVSEL
ncbi:MAG: hypothetical protein ACM3N0_03495, partial [Chloroflexota bacterium]